MTARNLLGELALEATQAQVRDTLTGVRTATGRAIAVGNARTKFRDGFASTDTAQPDPAVWTLINDAPDDGTGQGHIVNQGGDAIGASYLRISLSPFVDNSSVWLTSKEKFRIPSRVGWGISASQRIVGQEFLFGMAQADNVGGTDPTGLLRVPSATPADVPIGGTTGTVTSNSLVIAVPVGHPFRTGDRVILVGCADTRMNVGPVVINGASAIDISVPLTIANGSYSTVGGAVRYADAVGRANNGFGLLLENATATNASLVSRRNGSKARIRNSAIATTTAAAGGNWSDGFTTPAVHEQFLTMDECSYRSFAADTNGNNSGGDKFSQSIPDEELDYRLVVRARNLDDFSKPVARVVNMVKSGTSTATFTTDRPHGLTTSSRVGVYGAYAQGTANFPNDANMAVVSVPDATTFTAVIGTAGTASSTLGGVVFVNHGQVNSPGAMAFAIQSIARTNGVLVVTLTGTASGFAPGEYYQLWGMNGGGAAAYEGAYKVMRQVGSTVEFDSPGPNFGAITTGGALIKRTDFRLHFVRVLDHTRHLVEVLGGRGNVSDANNAVPVTVASATTLTVNGNASGFSPNPAVEEGAPLTTTNLALNAVYTQTAIDAGTTIPGRRDSVRVLVSHLAGQAHGYLTIEQSTDNSTFRETARVPIPSDGLARTFDFPVFQRYYRIRFTNGPIAQTAFYLSFMAYRGMAPRDQQKLLTFPMTNTAGQQITGTATHTGPTIDLGANHQWDAFRVLFVSDQATATNGIQIQQSFDGTTFFPTASATFTPATAGTAQAAPVLEDRIVARYVRLFIANGATASGATAYRSAYSLIPL